MFAAAWDDVVLRTTELMEVEAVRRGMVGVEKPVFQQGRQVGTIREYSDLLLMFMLKSRRPEVYRENHRVEHVGQGGRLDVNVVLDASQRDSLRELLRSRPVRFDAESGAVEPAALMPPVPPVEGEGGAGGEDGGRP